MDEFKEVETLLSKKRSKFEKKYKELAAELEQDPSKCLLSTEELGAIESLLKNLTKKSQLGTIGRHLDYYSQLYKGKIQELAKEYLLASSRLGSTFSMVYLGIGHAGDLLSDAERYAWLKIAGTHDESHQEEFECFASELDEQTVQVGERLSEEIQNELAERKIKLGY